MLRYIFGWDGVGSLLILQLFLLVILDKITPYTIFPYIIYT